MKVVCEGDVANKSYRRLRPCSISIMTPKVRRNELFIVWLLLDVVSTQKIDHPFHSSLRSTELKSLIDDQWDINNQRNNLTKINYPLYTTDDELSSDLFLNYSSKSNQTSSFKEHDAPYEKKFNSSFASSDVFVPEEKSYDQQTTLLKTEKRDALFDYRLQDDDNDFSFGPPPTPADPPSDLFTLPLQTSAVLPVYDTVVDDPLNKFLTAPSYNMEGSEIIEPEFIVPDNIAFAPPVPPPFVQPKKTYALTINDGTVKRNEVRKDNGEYISSYTSADGTMRSESARLIRTSTGEEVLVYKGSYSYTSPDGQKIRVDYTADRDGFRSSSTPVTARPNQTPQSPYQRPPQRPVQQPPQRPVQQIPQRPVQQPPQRPVQQPPQRPVQQPPQRPVQQPPQRPVPQIPQRPVLRPPQTSYQQLPQKPVYRPPQNPYQQPSQSNYQPPLQNPYQQPPQGPQTHPIAVQHLPYNSPKRPKKPPHNPLNKPSQIPIILLPKPHVQGHSRLPLVQPNQQSAKPPVFVKPPQKPVPHLTSVDPSHPIPPIPNMHRPNKG